MNAMHIRFPARPRVRLLALLPAVLLSGCQVVTAASPPESRLFANRAADSVQVAGVTTASSTTANALPNVRYIVKRGTLAQSLAIPGRVVPVRSAQLVLRGSGTVSAVNVKPGQQVKEGDALVEFTLDEDSLQAARTQATLAQLAAESQQARVDELKAGADAVAIAQIKATISADRANVQKLEQDQQAADAEVEHRAQAQQAASEAADRKIGVAEVALKAAQDALSKVQAEAKRVPSEIQSDKEDARAQAQAGVDAAAAALRGADRRVQLAEMHLSEAKLAQATTRGQQELATRQLSFDQAKELLTAARKAEEAAHELTAGKEITQRQIDAQIKAAEANVNAAERALAREALSLQQTKDNMAAAKLHDEVDSKSAAIALEQAKDDRARAQTSLDGAQKRLADIDKLRPSEQAKVDAAQAAIKEAQHKVETEQRNLQDAQAAKDAVDAQAEAQARSLAGPLQAARAQLAADQARLDALQSNNQANAIKREEIRANLLKNQADAALAAAQPVVVLRAPFDAQVTDVGVTLGQSLAPGDAGDTLTSGAAQSAQGRTMAVRLASSESSSVMAQASESDVSMLSVGQTVSLTFPGVSGQNASGKISEIGGAPTTGNDGKIAYPVRIDIPILSPDVKLGMSAQVGITIGQAQDVLMAPRETVRTVDGQQIVSRIDGDKVTDVVVHVGRTYGSQVELLDGVNEGDVLGVYLPTRATS